MQAGDTGINVLGYQSLPSLCPSQNTPTSRQLSFRPHLVNSFDPIISSTFSDSWIQILSFGTSSAYGNFLLRFLRRVANAALSCPTLRIRLQNLDYASFLRPRRKPPSLPILNPKIPFTFHFPTPHLDTISPDSFQNDPMDP